MADLSKTVNLLCGGPGDTLTVGDLRKFLKGAEPLDASDELDVHVNTSVGGFTIEGVTGV